MRLMGDFETTKPLKARLKARAKDRKMTVSALIRDILEQYFEDRHA